MVVESVVGGVVEGRGDGTSEEDGEDVVVIGVGLVLVKGEHNQRVVHEIAVVQEGLEEVARPGCSKGDRGVMTIYLPCEERFLIRLRAGEWGSWCSELPKCCEGLHASSAGGHVRGENQRTIGHVGGNERPLWESLAGDIRGERIEALDEREARGIVCH